MIEAFKGSRMRRLTSDPRISDEDRHSLAAGYVMHTYQLLHVGQGICVFLSEESTYRLPPQDTQFFSSSFSGIATVS